MKITPFCMDTIKGWTRASVVAFIALVAAELDVNNPSEWALLEPMSKVLDKAWLIPMHDLWLQFIAADSQLLMLPNKHVSSIQL